MSLQEVLQYEPDAAHEDTNPDSFQEESAHGVRMDCEQLPVPPPFMATPTDDDIVLYRGLMHPHYHSLFVVGVSRPSGGFWPIAEVQARFVAKLLSGQYKLPPQSVIEQASMPVLKRDSFNPALYGLSLREELARGARRI